MIILFFILQQIFGILLSPISCRYLTTTTPATSATTTPATSATTTPATSATTTPATSATTTSATSATTTSATSATTTPASTKYAPIYDSRLEFIFGDDLNNRRRLSATILGNFSSYGNRINVNGDVVKQYDPYRACSRSSLGLDSTLAGHIVVIMIKEILPFLAGCVIPYNQAKFARDSQAIGVILNVQTFRGSTYLNDFGQENFQSLGVPVVVVSGVQAQNMQIMLKKASYDGLQTKVFIKSNTLDIIAEKEHEENLANVGSNYIAKEAVFLPKFKEFLMPGGHDISVLCIIILMFAVMLFICIFLKMRYLPSSENCKQVQNDYKLAKQALAKMRLKKFRDHQSSKKRRNLHNFSPFLDKELGLLVDQSNFGSTVRTSWVGEERRLGRPLSSSTLNLDACAVCLEEFKDGEILRVITCGHDFHKSCIDPWLLKNHTCPLCLFNIIQEHQKLHQNLSTLHQMTSSDQNHFTTTSMDDDHLIARMLIKGYLRPAAPYYYNHQMNISSNNPQNQSKITQNQHQLFHAKQPDFASTSCLNGSICSNSTAFKPILDNSLRNPHRRLKNNRRNVRRRLVVQKMSVAKNNLIIKNCTSTVNLVEKNLITVEKLRNDNFPSEGYLSDISSSSATVAVALKMRPTKRRRSSSLKVCKESVVIYNCSRNFASSS